MVQRIFNRLKWILYSKSLNEVGYNSHAGVGFDIRGAKYICIGNNFHACKNVKLHVHDKYGGINLNNTPQMIIGDNVTITDGCFVSCANRVEIGDGTLLGENTFICDNYHGSNTKEEAEIPPNDRALFIGKPVIIGPNVWTGRNVCIMPGVSIGNSAVIGANAVVTHDVEAYTIVAGVPARKIGELDHMA